MSRYYSYLNSAKEILAGYNGAEPFASFLKKFFAAGKKFGSKDRKLISQLCYSYFRIGKMCESSSMEDRILTALFLCSPEQQETLQLLKPEWNDKTALPLSDKLSLLSGCSPADIFPFKEELSEDIDRNDFTLSHLQQPDVFLRLRPGKEDSVKNKLRNGGIGFDSVSDTCLRLPNASKIDSVIEVNRDAVIQDYSSQQVQEFFPSEIFDNEPGVPVWDCCAASGGKSILLYDRHPRIDLTVSDIRESIIVNLKKRFKEAGIDRYKSKIIDLASPAYRSDDKPGFRFIIADVPCSGSGTWGRTPEQLVYFKEEKIDDYASLQKRIVSNVIPRLQEGGCLLYITCSVFRKENEEAVEFVKSKFGMELVKMEKLKGYDRKADTMFAALLKMNHRKRNTDDTD